MRKFLGLVVILAAIVLGGYYGMGIITERTLKKNVVMINQSNGLRVDIQQYQRGWFTSMAKLHWLLHIPERVVKNQDGQSSTVPAQDYNLEMPLKIFHGPIIFADASVRLGLGYAYSDLSLPAEYAQQFSDLFSSESTKPEMKVSVLVNYLNRTRLRIAIPTFKLIAKEGRGNFEWFGLTNDVIVSSNLAKVKGDLVIDGMKFTKDTYDTQLGKVSSDYDLHQTQEGLYLGEANLSFPSLVIQDKNQKIFELEEFDVHSSSDIDGGLFNSYFKSSIEKIMAGSKVYGPGLLKMSIKNLDATALARINEEVNKLQQSGDNNRQHALIALLPELPKLFSKGPEFEISELNFVLPEGKLEGNLQISLPKGDMSNPFQLIQKIQGEGKIKIPSVVLHSVLQQSEKQRLATSANLPGAAAQQGEPVQAQPNRDSNANVVNDDTKQPNAAASGAPTGPADENTQGSTANVNALQVHNQQTQAIAADQSAAGDQADMDQKAKIQADQKLAALVQAGILISKDDDYIMEFKLAEGQLTVNGQPFNPATMKF